MPYNGYDSDQDVSKEKLSTLVLDTPGVRDAYDDARINRLVNNWTAKTLFRSTVKFKKWRKNYSKSGKITAHQPIPFRGTGSILFTQLHKGVTQAPDNHKVVIMFSGLKFSDKSFRNCLQVEYKGSTYYIEKPKLSKTTIRVRCSCKDFYFCFSLWDYQTRCIVGPKPKKYTRKTPAPPVGRPYRNPKKFPGLCKHVFNALEYLKSKGYVLV